MSSRVGTLSSRALGIYQEKGLVALIKKVFSFVASAASYSNSIFYVYEHTMRQGNEDDYSPKIQDVTHRMIETIEQLDTLVSKGYDLSLLDLDQCHYRLRKGAILNLVFVGYEFGYASWTALNKEAKNTFNKYPYKIDFENGEVCGGNSWTNPKYRRQGLSYYAAYKGEQYFIGKGITKYRSIVLTSNVASQNGSQKFGSDLVAKALYISIFGLQFWREKPIKSVKNL